MKENGKFMMFSSVVDRCDTMEPGKLIENTPKRTFFEQTFRVLLLVGDDDTDVMLEFKFDS